jgi:hypothetical protein
MYQYSYTELKALIFKLGVGTVEGVLSRSSMSAAPTSNSTSERALAHALPDWILRYPVEAPLPMRLNQEALLPA